MADYIWIVGILVVVAVFVWGLWRADKTKKERQRAELAKQQEAAQAAMDLLQAAEGELTRLPDLSGQVTGLILHPGECCFAACKGVQHVVEAHRTRYVGGSQGVSFRIAKGVRYHVGGFSGRPVTTTYERVADTGDLYVTTERVVFAGSREVTSINANKVADVRVEGDHLWLIAENRKTPLGLRFAGYAPLVPVMAYATRLPAENSHRYAARAGPQARK